MLTPARAHSLQPSTQPCHSDRSGPMLFLPLRSCEGVGPRSGGISLRSIHQRKIHQRVSATIPVV